MTQFLLDTNIVSQLVRYPQGRVAERIASVGEGRVVTSIIVACELRFGVARKKSERLTRDIEMALRLIPVLPFGDGADVAYGVLRVDLEGRGLPIGNNDMLIAAHALAINATLVSDNVREFKRVAGLRLENWLRDD